LAKRLEEKRITMQFRGLLSAAPRDQSVTTVLTNDVWETSFAANSNQRRKIPSNN